MSVFRRSLTDFRLDGFASTTSMPLASSTSSNGTQYTPVASTATVLTPHSMIQSASSYSPRVFVENFLTDGLALSSGTATQWYSAPASTPPACSLICSHTRLFFFLVPEDGRFFTATSLIQ